MRPMKTTHGTMTFFELMSCRDKIIIPDFQRKKVWDQKHKQTLLDTVLSDCPIPNLLVATYSDKDAIIVVDGQQRMTTLFQLVDGEVKLTPASAAELKLDGVTYAAFSDAQCQHLDAYEIPVTQVIDVPHDDLMELFRRLQNGVPLNSTEILNATKSGFRDCCKELSTRLFFTEKVAFLDTRQQHFKMMMYIAAIAINGLNIDLSTRPLGNIVKAQKDFSLDSSIARNLVATLDFLARAFPNKSKLLRQTPFVQSLMVLASQLVATGRSEGQEAAFAQFAKNFQSKLSEHTRMQTRSVHDDYERYLTASRTDRKEPNITRHEVLTRKLAEYDPELAQLMGIEGNMSAFSGLVQKAARAKGVLSVSAFERYLSGNGSIQQLFPDSKDRSDFIERALSLYNGQQQPIHSNNLSRDAGIVIHVIGIGSADLIEALPSLKHDLLYTDALRAVNKELAVLMRRRGLYTLTSIEALYPEGLFADHERPLVLEIFSSTTHLKDMHNSWAITRIKQALNEAPEEPSCDKARLQKPPLRLVAQN